MARQHFFLFLLLVSSINGCDRDRNGNAESRRDESLKDRQIMLNSENPLLSAWKTPLQVPPFDRIRNGHFLPAYEKALTDHELEIAAILRNPEPATFENTILPFEKSGELLARVSKVFANLTSANTDSELEEISAQTAPVISQHWDKILMDAKLFQRIKAVHDQIDNIADEESKRLVDKIYKDFTRGGSLLVASEKKELQNINEKLSVLNDRFSQNTLRDTNTFELVVTNPQDVKGMPSDVLASAQEEAARRGYDGGWVFTTHRPSITPFLTYTKNRELRRKIYEAYLNIANNNNEADNKETIEEMVDLRIRKANLLGFPNYAAFALESETASTPEQAYDLLGKVWQKALKRAKIELAQMQQIADREGLAAKLEAHDWWYYAEKLRKEQYDLTEEEIRPYFTLEATREGAFYVASKLFGITFNERFDLPVYHSDVRTFEVRESNGELLGLYYVDYFVRSGKKGGAWMDEVRTQTGVGKDKQIPVIINVLNLNRPALGQPVLLTLDEAETLFHEFGHALHGLFSNVSYKSLAGTSVARDFVEFPSQILEYWLTERDVLRYFARHYQTGEAIPDALIEKINNAKKFNQGFANVEYLAASFLDLAWHTLEQPTTKSVTEFENDVAASIGLIPEIYPRYRSTYFQHVFPWGYSASYYSYLWSNVLAADAFAYFKSVDVFSSKIGANYREHILAKGNSKDPTQLYEDFRGRKPDPNALIEHLGL